jgi:hypothetical protein
MDDWVLLALSIPISLITGLLAIGIEKWWSRTQQSRVEQKTKKDAKFREQGIVFAREPDFYTQHQVHALSSATFLFLLGIAGILAGLVNFVMAASVTEWLKVLLLVLGLIVLIWGLALTVLAGRRYLDESLLYLAVLTEKSNIAKARLAETEAKIAEISDSKEPPDTVSP